MVMLIFWKFGSEFRIKQHWLVVMTIFRQWFMERLKQKEPKEPG
jgi:hypothetical protein